MYFQKINHPSQSSNKLCALFKIIRGPIFFVENGETDFKLVQQIYSKIRILARFDSGTKPKIDPLCGLAREYIQPYEIADLFSKPNFHSSII